METEPKIEKARDEATKVEETAETVDPKETVDPNVKETDDPAPMSKRQLKKQKKREEYLATRAERRKEEKLKRKVKMERMKKEKDFDCSYYSARKRLKKDKTMAGSDSKVHVVLDLAFEDKMNQKDLGKCCKQVLHCYG